MRQLKIFLLLFIFVLIFPQISNASFSFSVISIDPTEVSSKDQEVVVNISITDLPSESYFRAEWQQTSGSTYFGYSKNNGGDWVKVDSSQDCKNYFKISDTATTSAVLVTKIGSDNNPENGIYSLKARRYTSGCSASDSNALSITINLPTPTPAQTPEPTSAPTAAPTSTPVPTPTKTPTPKPTIKPTPTESPDVLGEETSMPTTIEPEPSPTEEPLTASDKKFPILPAVLILLGFGLVSFAGFSLFRKVKSEYNEGNE